MALSSKCKLRIFLLIGFAVVLQPSSAIRAEGAPAADPRAAPPSGIPPLPPQPRECRPWLMRMMPCAGFITNSSVYAPEPSCCGGFNSMFAYGTVTCLCHVVNGDVGRLLPAPMIHARMVELFSVCGHDVRVEMLAAACNLTNDVPPIDLPSPPPSTPTRHCRRQRCRRRMAMTN
ncbi:hypothetical protein PAHAL_2G123000 [Panicum hallii]|uniref:Bifunctional inhibitor/plant lipid transfer protein/seed storage helical domain-containing protein n=1 Tax=Panicum hallii TaxID=206008 RepID=A0A2T8KNT4_9POAL|nr:hypothetical protein PAHAL_2G123000 [Panicum hallii]